MPFTWSCVKMKMISVVCLHFVISTQRMCFFQMILPRNNVNANYTRIYLSSQRQWGVVMKVLGGKLFYVTYPQTVHAGITHVMITKMAKSLQQEKGLNVLACYKQWEYTEAPSHSKNKDDDTYKKIAIVMKEVGLKKFLISFRNHSQR